ncbi:MAG: hypothetical protein ABIG43_04035 [Chloroflexota bacterium]
MMQKYYKWIARIIGSVFALFWLFIGVASGFDDPQPMNWESISMTLLIGAATISVIIAWFRERLGGALLIFVGAAYSVFALITSGEGISNKLIAVMSSGFPYIIIGVLFLLSSRKPKEKDQELDEV